MALCLDETGIANRLQNALRRSAGLDRVPVITHESRRFRIRGQVSRHEGHHPAHVGLEQCARHPSLRWGDLQQTDPAAGYQHAQELLERRGKIADVAQGIAHRHKIRRRGSRRYGLRGADDQLDAFRQKGTPHHAGAGIDSRHLTGLAHQQVGLARRQPGTHADIEHPHARFEAGAAQSAPSVPGSGSQGHEPLDTVIINGRAVE